MPTENEKLHAEIDRLYGLPLDQFTPARDELAKRLRGEGERDASADVKRLRKPSLLAWGLNQVRHRDPERVDQLIDAGQRLQEAQQQLVAGGERGLLRDAAADERRLVEEVVALAERELSQAGHPVGAAVESKLWSTVHAAALSPEPRALLRAGRLLRDYEVSDLGLMGAGPAVVAPARETPKQKEAPKKGTRRRADGRGRAEPDAAELDAAELDAAEREAAAREAAEREADRKAAERKARGIRRELERARARHRKLADKLTETQRRAAEARRQATKAATELERAEASVEQADVHATTAADLVRELETELSELGL